MLGENLHNLCPAIKPAVGPFCRDEGAKMQKSQFKYVSLCWICGHKVDLETCKTDEDGKAVHEDCYALKVALARESKPVMVRVPPHRVTALFYLLSGLKTRRSGNHGKSH